MDVNFGSKLGQLDRTMDTWLIESAANDAAVARHYQSEASNLSGEKQEIQDLLHRWQARSSSGWMVSTIRATAQSADQECIDCLSFLRTFYFEEAHSEHKQPVARFRVYGAVPTATVRAGIGAQGLTEIQELEDGFTAGLAGPCYWAAPHSKCVPKPTPEPRCPEVAFGQPHSTSAC